MTSDLQLTTEQVCNDMHADAEQIKLLRDYLALLADTDV